jgi:hypothetical protein
LGCPKRPWTSRQLPKRAAMIEQPSAAQSQDAPRCP